MELEVTKDSPAGKESAAHAGHQLPVMKVARIAGLGHMVCLLNQLAINLITEGPEVMAGLQNALDNRNGVRHSLKLLKRVKDLHGFILEAAVAFLLLHCRGRGDIKKQERERTSATLHAFDWQDCRPALQEEN